MTVKLLYLWLEPVVKTSLSQWQIARAVGISQGAVSLSLARLRVLRLKTVEEARLRVSGGADEPVPLPSELLEENPTTKPVYLYLSSRDEVEVSIRQLEALLGISHRPTAEAMWRLIALELLKMLRLPLNNPGRYKLATTQSGA